MELKEAIEITRQKIIEALTAITAEDYDVAKNCLTETHNFLQAVSPEHDITELVDTETPLEGLRDQERAAQDSAGNEPMLNLTKNIKQIEYLADRTLVNVQAVKYDAARDNLLRVSFHNDEALQKLNKLIKLQQHIDDGSKKVEG